jgi:hypothetical protein
MRWRRSATTAAAAWSDTEFEKDEAIYCCVHCAEHEGVKELRDRA